MKEILVPKLQSKKDVAWVTLWHPDNSVLSPEMTDASEPCFVTDRASQMLMTKTQFYLKRQYHCYGNIARLFPHSSVERAVPFLERKRERFMKGKEEFKPMDEVITCHFMREGWKGRVVPSLVQHAGFAERGRTYSSITRDFLPSVVTEPKQREFSKYTPYDVGFVERPLTTEQYQQDLEFYIGCFEDHVNRRVMSVFLKDIEKASVRQCRTVCGNLGYPYAGLEFGGECFCSDMFSFAESPLFSKGCFEKCKEGGKCGGRNEIAVYAAGPCR